MVCCNKEGASVLRFDILTLFPDIFESYLAQSILNRAIDRQLIEIHCWNIRNWARGKHRVVDDRPFGGGPGMILKPEPVCDAVETVRAKVKEPGKLIMLTPQGRPLDQNLVDGLAQQRRLLLLCGRYEGFDERIRLGLNPIEISIGDYICSGGEVPSMVLIDSVVRLLPGVLGDEQSACTESFQGEQFLEYPQYTRPRDFRSMSVPDVLVSGNHEAVAQWRREQSRIRTRTRRPDLLEENL